MEREPVRNIFIGVAWPYVNGDLHIGHYAGYLLPADICARYHRLTGNNVLMVSGSDCHGTPITVEADKRDRLPEEIVEEYHQKDVDLFLNKLDLSYDLYTRTDSKHHISVTQKFFLRLLEEDYIFIDTTPQYYAESEGRFLPDRYIEGICPHCRNPGTRSDYCEVCNRILEQGEIIEPLSKLSHSEVILKDTEHYFVDWARLQEDLNLEAYVKENGVRWKNWVSQEALGWLKEGLKPRAITRDIDWGVPLPKELIPQEKRVAGIDNKRIYVWFDAVIGYYSASLLWARMRDSDTSHHQAAQQAMTAREEAGLLEDVLADWWLEKSMTSKDLVPCHYYFMGQDNLIFHTLFWPAQLAVYNSQLHRPDFVSINKFLNLEGEAFSKSRGITIPIREMVDEFGNDMVRFYLTLIMPENKPSSFYWSDFQEKVNGILIGNIGNFIHRVLTLATDSDIDKITAANLSEEDQVYQERINSSFDAARMSLENCQFQDYLRVITNLSKYGNVLVDHRKLWELDKDSKMFQATLKVLYQYIVTIGYLSQPLMPQSSKRVFDLLGLDQPDRWPDVGSESTEILVKLSKAKTNLNLEPLFQKITDEQIEPHLSAGDRNETIKN